MTASPFFLCALFLIFAYVTQISSFNYQSGWQVQTELIATLLSVASISLMSYTIGSHRVPLNLWHQSNNNPDHIVTYGPYKKIRHPFYTSFLLTLIGAFIFFMHPLTLFTLIFGIIAMQITAVKEEKYLSKCDDAYREYMKKTGRFFPKYWADKG
jgi:protein-S-isoprenylcysteine O-methyltransferase Ste14